MADNNEEEKQQDTRMMTLCSSDGEKFQVSRHAASVSELIQSTLSCEEDDDNVEMTAEVPLPRVRGEVLKHIVDFMAHHADDPMPEITVPIEGTSVGEVRSCSLFSLFVSPRVFYCC